LRIEVRIAEVLSFRFHPGLVRASVADWFLFGVLIVMKILAPAVVLVVFLGLTSFAQKAPPPPPPRPAPPPPIAKPTPGDTIEKTDEEFAAEVVASTKEPVAWKQREFSGFAVSVLMPRPPIRQTETSYETGLGRTKTVIYVSVGEGSVFLIGKTSLPYRVTDDKVLRDLYRALANGMSEEGSTPFQHIRDLEIAGKLAVEMRSLPSDVKFQSALSRSFVVDRDVYILMAMPSEDENIDEPPGEELIEKRTAEFDRFFNSIVIEEPRANRSVPELPIFASSFDGKRFRSEYFRFSLQIPEGWRQITPEDIEDIQNWGRTTIKEETGGRTLPTNRRRTSLSAFTSGPLGEEQLAMIAITVAGEARSFEDVKRVATATGKLAEGLSTYQIIEPLGQMKLGSLPAMRMKNRITMAGMVQEQYIHFFLRQGRVLGLTITCMKQIDCSVALAATSSIEFEK